MRTTLILLSTLLSSTSFSQIEPVDKNDAGLYIGGSVRGGQAYRPGGDGSAGGAFGGGAEFGYVMPRDTWDRVEVGVELSLAEYNFDIEDSRAVKINNSPQVLVKFGYGYSLGAHTFGIFRVGAGVARADIEIDGVDQAIGFGDPLGGWYQRFSDHWDAGLRCRISCC